MTNSSDSRQPTDDLSGLIERQRALGPAVALRVGGRDYSYAELASLVEQRTAALARAGVTTGDLVLCPTTPLLDSILMQWALARLGAAMLPIRADLSRSRRETLTQATGAEWWWEPADSETHAVPTASRKRHAKGDTERIWDAERLAAGALIDRRSSRVGRPESLPRRSTSKNALAPKSSALPSVLVETSGSSAEPKLVMLSAANIAASCKAVNARLDLKCSDRWLCVLPRHHVGGLAIGYRCAFAGAELVVQPRFDAEAVQALLQDRCITHLSLVPAMLAQLLRIESTPPPDLRVVLIGGQGLDRNLGRRAVEHGWPLYLGYGMTETFSQIAGGWVGAEGIPTHGLRPLRGVQIRCPSCKRDSQQVPALRIRAPMLMLGYANPARAPGDGLNHGWLRTADLACRLPSGRMQVMGRADEVVLIAGINVLPAEIEHALARLDQITEIAVVGVPDPTWGHRLVALYTGNLEPKQLDDWCRSNLPSHQRPRAFERLEILPTLSSGKRDRRAIIAHAEAVARCETARGW